MFLAKCIYDTVHSFLCSTTLVPFAWLPFCWPLQQLITLRCFLRGLPLQVSLAERGQELQSGNNVLQKPVLDVAGSADVYSPALRVALVN